MNKVNIAAFLVALLVVGAIAAPRKLLETTDASEAAASSEQHQRILAELEELKRTPPVPPHQSQHKFGEIGGKVLVFIAGYLIKTNLMHSNEK
ncbi:TPA: hypothetical protein ACH3X3_012561 [Trebouxia sp. C0006]